MRRAQGLPRSQDCARRPSSILATPGRTWLTESMPTTRRRFLALTALGTALGSKANAREAAPARLGILLDTSAEMGFVVPQVRKEWRVLNEQLAAVGRPPVVLREMTGSDLDREASTSVGARRNALYGLKALFEEVDTVIWITPLKGGHSPQGIFAVEQLLRESMPDRPVRQLVLRNIWQDQLLAGNEWVRWPPEPELDPLDPRNRPEEWFRVVEEGHGVIQRSWQVPPVNFRAQFAFPHRVAESSFLRKLGHEGREVFFDQAWAQGLSQRHDLHFVREKEEWSYRITGRQWTTEATLLPFPDEEKRAGRSERVFEELCTREPIGSDLDRIEAAKLGVLFAFGYVSSDWKRHLSVRDQKPRSWRDHYLADLARLGGECAKAAAAGAGRGDRLYASERIEIESRSTKTEGVDAISRHIAKLVREEKCDAIYLFTNGYLGNGDYGTWSIDWTLLALAIREAGTRLYVRVPFEFGPTPLTLARLAMASGGGVFRGRADDPDWEMELPVPSWPEPPGSPEKP